MATSPTATDFLQRAREHERAYRYPDGLREIEAALALDPQLAEAYLLRAKLYFFSLGTPYTKLLPIPNETERAAIVADFEQVVRLAPTDIAVLMECAQWLGVMRSLGGVNRAIEIYTAIIMLDPTLRQVYLMRGMVYQAERRYTEALADFDRAIQLDPTSPDGYAARGQIYEHQRQRVLAAADFQQALVLGHTGFYTEYMRDYVWRYGKPTTED